MRRGAAAAVAVAGALLALAPAPAGAQFAFEDDGTRVVRVHELPVATRGGVAIEYRGDEAAGCAERRLCQVSGTSVWRAPREGALIVAETVRRGRRGAFATLIFEDDGVVRTRTERAGGARCLDARRSGGAFELPTPSASVVSVGIAGLPAADDLVRTRCAGPLGVDVAAALPARDVPLRELRSGRLTLDLSGDREWRGGGFAGVVRSTVTLELGRARADDDDDDGVFPRGVRVRRNRTVVVSYRVERAGGTIAARYTGVGDALACGPLDSCGVDGATAIRLAGAGGSLDLLADGPAALPRRRFLAALGIVRGGRARGIELFAGGTLTGLGAPAASLTRDGEPDCADTGAPLELGLRVGGRGRARAVFEVTAFGGTGSLRTRCPGPLDTDVADEGALVAAIVPLRSLGRRRVVLRVRRVRGFDAPGWAGVVDGDVELVLRRVRIREHTYPAPVFDDAY